MSKRKVYLLSIVIIQSLLLWFSYECPVTNGDPTIGSVIGTFILSNLIVAVIQLFIGLIFMGADVVENQVI